MTDPEQVADREHLVDLVRMYGTPCTRGDVLPVTYWTSDSAAQQAQAAKACRFCPVLPTCRSYGTTYPEHGVYGALTDHQRSRIQRQESA